MPSRDRREYMRQYHLKHRDRGRTPERQQYMHEYYEANREVIRARSTADYRANTAHKHGLMRAWKLKHPYYAQARRFGLTEEDFEMAYAMCEGRCLICGIEFDPPGTKPGTTRHALTVDHDHKTGKVRGLLCSRCNIAIGRLDDDPKLLREAAKYLADAA